MFGLFKKDISAGKVVGGLVVKVEGVKVRIDKSARKIGIVRDRDYEYQSHVMCYIIGTAAINLSNYNDAEKVLLGITFSEVWGKKVNMYTDKVMTHDDLVGCFTTFYSRFNMLVKLFHKFDETIECLYDYLIMCLYEEGGEDAWKIVGNVSKEISLTLEVMITDLNQSNKKYKLVSL